METHELKPTKIMTPRLIVLLCILAVGIVVALYMWLVYVPYMREYDEWGVNTFEEPDLDGDGTPQSPYLIKTVEDLAEFAEKVNNGSSYREKYFLLVNNIDMTGYLSEGGAGYNDGAGWIMIGSYKGTSFGGIFDGAGHTISGLWVNRPDETAAGLFGQIRGAEIYRLNVEAISITALTAGGALAGDSRNSTIVGCTAKVEALSSACPTYMNSLGGLIGDLRGSVVENCSAIVNSETVISQTTSMRFGGLIGYAIQGSSIINSSATVNVVLHNEGFTRAGGLVGELYGASTIVGSYSDGRFHSNTSVGGLVGRASDSGTFIRNSGSSVDISSTGRLGGFIAILGVDAEITGSYATGNVSCADEGDNSCSCTIGGFAGWSWGTIKSSFATGNVTTTYGSCDESGGFAGEQFGGLISDCYSTGNSRGSYANSGGFAGNQSANAIIKNCYAAGSVQYRGFFANQRGTVESCYFDIDKARTEYMGYMGDTAVGEVVGKTTAEMLNADTFEGWDFINVWFMPENDYPKLR